jgi:hypothetical protein
MDNMTFKSEWQGSSSRVWRQLIAILIAGGVIAWVLGQLPVVRFTDRSVTTGFIKYYPATGFQKLDAAMGINGRVMSCSASLLFQTPKSCPQIAEGSFVNVTWMEQPAKFEKLYLALKITDENGKLLFEKSPDEVQKDALKSAWPLIPLLLPFLLALAWPYKRAKALSRFSD